MLKQWIVNNISDFNNNIKTEEDLKIKVLLPYLRSLGYTDSEFRFEHSIDVTIGTKKTTVFSDLEIIIDGKVEIVIDTKSPSKSISEKDVLQSASYAKLINTPPALYGITTNGLECIVTNVYTGKRISEIPTKTQLIRDIDKSKKKPLRDVELREVESILFTLHNTKELYKVIQDSKDVIEKRGLIRSDQSFREMTKIILIKMNEERRVKAKEGNNRFSNSYLSSAAKVNETTELVIFNQLFDEAKAKYPSIYTNENETVLDFTMGKERLGEVYILDFKTKQPIMKLQGRRGTNELKITILSTPIAGKTKINEIELKFKCQITKFQLCAGCHACENACKHSAIRLIKDGEGDTEYKYLIDENKCVHCFECINHYTGGCYMRRVLLPRGKGYSDDK